jgi:hypothetical protein
LGQDGNGFFFANDTTGSNVRFLTNNGTLNEWMRITSAGRVGIDTETPAATLEVNGTGLIDGALTGYSGTFEGANGGLMAWDTQVNDTSQVHYGSQGYASDYYSVGVSGNAYDGTNVSVSFADSAGGLGVFGAGAIGVLGYAGSGVANGSTGVVGQAGGGYGLFSYGPTGATGTKSAVVPLPDNRVVALYAMESPEVWFEDLGSATLQGGVAVIPLEPTFTLSVNTTLPYHVYVTAEGDCEGLYVTNKTPTSFEVRELRGGTSNVAFEYRIIAKRSGYENLRMEQLQADAETIQAMREQSRTLPTRVPSIKVTKGGPVPKIKSPQAKP